MKVKFSDLNWVNEASIPHNKVYESLKIEKDDPEQIFYLSHITTSKDNPILKSNDVLLMIAPCSKLLDNDIVLVKVEHEKFEGHLYQLKLFEGIFELRPLSTFLNQETIKGKIENIGDIKIQAKALKVIRDIGG